jgi:hypothetical protein
MPNWVEISSLFESLPLMNNYGFQSRMVEYVHFTSKYFKFSC